MMAPAIALLRNKWVLLIGGLVYMGLIWSIFLVVNHHEIVQGELHRSPTTLDEQSVMEMYKAFQQQDAQIHDELSLLKLTEALIHQGKLQEAQEVSHGLLVQEPTDQSLRFQLALALHNAGLYEEAESHFSILLEERGEL